MTFVLDASVTLAWLFEDEVTPETDSVLERFELEEALVPKLWLYEVANVLVVGERRKRIMEAQSHRFMALLADLPIRVAEANRNSVWSAALPLAREQALSVYDAAYLELAMSEALPLATRDKGLKAAAANVGVPVLGEGS
ncbi:MAG: type II toxin-antitoxin system VapC family toxin [Gammaproteobacteria bacterium]|nr:type II toxin-antitoxin system VapC family toxin [Gammaproteobacteria bacterium]